MIASGIESQERINLSTVVHVWICGKKSCRNFKFANPDRISSPPSFPQKCWFYTRQLWATAYSKCRTRRSWKMQILWRSSRTRKKLTSCAYWTRLCSCSQESHCDNSLKLNALHRFTSTATAVEDITALQEGKLGPGLKKFLTDEVVNKGKGKDTLVVAESHLGSFLHWSSTIATDRYTYFYRQLNLILTQN